MKVALFARNAGKVDGLDASRTPRPNRLLALGADGKFPASAIPAISGPAGPPGPVGPRGPLAGRAYTKVVGGPPDFAAVPHGDILDLPLPRERAFVVLARVNVRNEGAVEATLVCRLWAHLSRRLPENAEDRAAVTLPARSHDSLTLGTTVVKTDFRSDHTIVSCGSQDAAEDLRIGQSFVTAVEVAAVEQPR